MDPPRKRTSARIAKGVQKKYRADYSVTPNTTASGGRYIAQKSVYTFPCKAELKMREDCVVKGEPEDDQSDSYRINGGPSSWANVSSVENYREQNASLGKYCTIKVEQEERDISLDTSQDLVRPSVTVDSHEPLQDQKIILKDKEEDQNFAPETDKDKKLKPYICFCGKSYTCTSHLNRHRKSHGSGHRVSGVYSSRIKQEKNMVQNRQIKEENNIVHNIQMKEENSIIQNRQIKEENNIVHNIQIKEETNIAQNSAIKEENNVVPNIQIKEENIIAHNYSPFSDEKFTERGFACQCGKRYTRKSNLKRHQNSCNEQTLGETLDNTIDNTVTYSNVEDQEEMLKPYVCACGKSYTSSSHLYRHQRTHVTYNSPPEKRYNCECGKSYSCGSHLNRHRKTHTEESVLGGHGEVEEPEDLEKRVKPYACFCGKSYTCSSHLYRHQKAHHTENVSQPENKEEEDNETEKRYKCDCGKSYSSSSHLYRHQRKHRMPDNTTEVNDLDDSELDLDDCRQKLYKCECGKSFILSFSLLLHKKIHCRWKHSTDSPDH